MSNFDGVKSAIDIQPLLSLYEIIEGLSLVNYNPTKIITKYYHNRINTFNIKLINYIYFKTHSI